MRRGYGLMRRLFAASKEKHYQIDGGMIYFSEGHFIVRMPIGLYDREIAGKSNGRIPSAQELIMSTNIDVFVKKLANLETNLAERLEGMFKVNGRTGAVVLETTVKRNGRPIGDRVVLNGRFYAAAEQMTRGGNIRIVTRRIDPAIFMSPPDSFASEVMVIVAPINYRELPVQDAA